MRRWWVVGLERGSGAGRRTVTGMRWGGSRLMRARMSGTEWTGWPSKARMTSLGWTPAFWAGESGMIWATRTRDWPGGPSQMPWASVTATILKPMKGRTTRPCFRSWRTTCQAASMGMANEIPSAICAFIVFTPTTRPSKSTRGPPELPTLIAQSTCRNSLRCDTMPISEPCRAVAETMPAVTELAKFNGEPQATTKSPGFNWEDDPIFATGSLWPFSMRTNATSLWRSIATNLARKRRPSFSVTAISRPFCTTCAFVTTRPSSLTMKPDPAPNPRCTPKSVGCATSTVMLTTAGSAFAAAHDTKFRRNSCEVPRGSAESKMSSEDSHVALLRVVVVVVVVASASAALAAAMEECVHECCFEPSS
mmetsp:Transcript_160/g.463  ORF Transcript_160/g.463 Transcript_160/m.463 type:complete len:365 (-) Transcript_160:152-1246(-)